MKNNASAVGHITKTRFPLPCNMTSGSPPSGAAGTLNWMLDAVLSSPRTRSMYVRRLRTLMDSFTNGRLEVRGVAVMLAFCLDIYDPSGILCCLLLQELVTEFYNQVKAEAERDNAKWGNPGTPERGYTCVHAGIMGVDGSVRGTM